MKFILGKAKFGIYRLLTQGARAVSARERKEFLEQVVHRVLSVLRQLAKNWPNMPVQEKIHGGMLRGLRNISDTP